MIRNTIIYRRIWYIKRRNAKRLYFYFRLLSIVIILSVLIFYAENYSVPYINNIVEQQLRIIVQNEVNDTVSEMHNGKEGLDNPGEMSLRISRRLDRKLKAFITEGIPVSAGALLGDYRFSEYGPEIRLKSRLLKDTETVVKTPLRNNEKRKINVYVKLKIGITLIFEEREIEIKTYFPVTEKIYLRNKL